MCEKRQSKTKLGLLGFLSAAAVGEAIKLKVSSSHATPAVRAPVAAAEQVSTGSGFPTGTVVLTVLVTAVVALVTWFVVGKIRDMIADRRADRARTADQVRQMTARRQAEQQPIEPRLWRFTLTERIDNDLRVFGPQVVQLAATSARQAQREVLRRAMELRPSNYDAQVELVDQ